MLVFACLLALSVEMVFVPAPAFAPPNSLKGQGLRNELFESENLVDAENYSKANIGIVIRSSDPSDRTQTIVTKDRKISMTALAGIKGYQRPGKWLPVQISVQNSGPDISGRLEVIVEGAGMNYPIVIHQKKLDLPEGAQKRVEFTVMTEQPSLKVRYVSEDKTVLQTVVRALWTSPEFDLIGVLTDEDSDLNFYKDIVALNRESKLAVFHYPLELPETSLGLGALDVLILNRTSSKDLTEKQKQAVLGWIKDGGTLVLGGGLDAAKVVNGLPADMVPVDIGETKLTQTLPPALSFAKGYTSSVPLMYATIKGVRGDIVLGDEQTPFVVSEDIGRGRILWAAFDLSAKPFSEWRGNESFWRRIALKDGLSVSGNSGKILMHGGFEQFLYSISALKAPKLSMVMAFLFLYLLVISPLNYVILKKLDKREWAWITIPFFIIIFGLSSYWYAYINKGGDVIVNQVGVLEISTTYNDADLMNFFGIFSPGKASYNIELPKGMAGSPSLMSWGGPMASVTPAVIDHGNTNRIRDFSVAAWTMRSFTSTGRIPFKSKLTCDLRYTKDGIEGTIRNGFDFPLTDVSVVAGTHIRRLGSIQPGKERRVSVSFKNDAKRMGPIGQEFFRVKNERNGIIGGPASYDNNASMKIEMINQLLGYEGEYLPKSPSILAWTGRPFATPAISGKKPIYKGQTLIMHPINIDSKDYFMLHPGQMKRALVKKTGVFRQAGVGFSVSTGSAEFEYKLELPEAKKYTVLNINLGFVPQGPAQAFKTHAYNIKTQSWTEVKFKKNKAELTPPEEYISPDNTIKTKIEISAKPQWGEVFFRDFDVEVVGKWR